MPRNEIEKHEAVCPRALVKCPHSDTCGKIRRGDLDLHFLTCEYKPVDCTYCGFRLIRRQLEDHFVDCPDLPLTCPHCAKLVPQKRMRRHLDRECESKKHDCPYASQGCKIGELSAAELSEHLTKDAGEHLELVQLNMSSTIKIMENRFLKMLAIKDAEIEELKRVSRNRYRFAWNIDWKHSPNDPTIRAYTSEKFDVFGHQFYLALWPVGEPKDSAPIASPALGALQQPQAQSSSSSTPSTQPTTGQPPARLERASSLTSTPNEAIQLSTSPPSVIPFFDRLRNFARARSSSTDSIGSNTSNSERNQPPTTPTYVALYLMMEDDPRVAAPSNAPPIGSPSIYSPISGLINRSSEGAIRPMNVQMNRGGIAPQSYAVRPPESMILEYTLRLVNASPLLSKSVYFEITFPLQHGNGWGEEKFIETTLISKSSGFLTRNSVLQVQCDIQVRQCTFEV